MKDYFDNLVEQKFFFMVKVKSKNRFNWIATTHPPFWLPFLGWISAGGYITRILPEAEDYLNSNYIVNEHRSQMELINV